MCLPDFKFTSQSSTRVNAVNETKIVLAVGIGRKGCEEDSSGIESSQPEIF